MTTRPKAKLHPLLSNPRLLSLWPPFLGAGIRVVRYDAGTRSCEVELRQRRSNVGISKVHFGGSLFAMTDPFYMFLIIQALGPDYVVWDKAGSIRFRRPGLGTVRAHFELTNARLAEIRAALDRDGIVEPVFQVNIVNADGEVVSQVERVLYCATREAHEARAAARRSKPS